MIWNRNTSGKKHKRFREMFEKKQEISAFDLGDNFNQKQFHLFEQKEGFNEDLFKTTVYNFSKEKRKKESQKFIIEDFKKQVYDEKYNLQGGDFLSYHLDLNLLFKNLEQYLRFLL
ncbi:hypothetical protein [Chryseobacterium arthrosphaerae]|uniref:hypothetical protein n=1 Tax=Chryseobacterium arthrosphaerae TaxID=651561 RepID=UPI0031D38EA1